jgi:hypothetical protein
MDLGKFNIVILRSRSSTSAGEMSTPSDVYLEYFGYASYYYMPGSANSSESAAKLKETVLAAVWETPKKRGIDLESTIEVTMYQACDYTTSFSCRG